MIETTTLKRHKIDLADYDYRSDIENRLLMADFTVQDVEVLEELLYSSLSISLAKLSKNLSIDTQELLPSLEKLAKTGLFVFENETLLVDKEMRKYYEFQIVKFEEDTIPGMEFLQGLLKKPPIHVLPLWYNIPRTSNNIFDSLVEKYLFTPQIFTRYLSEFQLAYPDFAPIIEELFASEELELPASYVMEKYHLSREQFEEVMLYLEFNFICCVSYRREADRMQGVLTPFNEWRNYLQFVRNTETPALEESHSIARLRPSDFAFVQDMALVLFLAKKTPLPLDLTTSLLQEEVLQQIAEQGEDFDLHSTEFAPYMQRVVERLRWFGLAQEKEGRLHAMDFATSWLEMRLENRAIFLYRHPLTWLEGGSLAAYAYTEKQLREAEKSIKRVLHSGWVELEPFLQGVMVTLSDASHLCLKRVGRSWKYLLPEYTQEENALLRATLFDWLFEVGVVAVGHIESKPCFTVTEFGKSLFGR